MLDRFRRTDDPYAPTREQRVATHDEDLDGRDGGVATRERTVVAPRERLGERTARRRGLVSDPAPAATTHETMRSVRARQRDEFGGFSWGAAFFGWLVAVGFGALLTGVLSAASVAIGLTDGAGNANGDAETIGLVGGLLFLAVLGLAYYAGGYVAGRMSRFDGARQGLGVWIVGLVIAIALAVAGAILGSEYNVLSQLNLPSLPISGDTLTTAGIVAGIAALLVTLLGAVLGGKLGTRYHRKVDRAGFDV